MITGTVTNVLTLLVLSSFLDLLNRGDPPPVLSADEGIARSHHIPGRQPETGGGRSRGDFDCLLPVTASCLKYTPGARIRQPILHIPCGAYGRYAAIRPPRLSQHGMSSDEAISWNQGSFRAMTGIALWSFAKTVGSSAVAMRGRQGTAVRTRVEACSFIFVQPGSGSGRG